MKILTLILVLLFPLALKAQHTFNSTHYQLDGKVYNTSTEIVLDLGKPPIVFHNNGLSIHNYPLKLRDIKDSEEPFVVTLEPDITPVNYDSTIFKSYGYRGFQIYFKEGKIIGVVEIIKSYNSERIKIIKYQ
ncbi:hypothetical protein [Chryseobacterium lathyri]|jgi:hypothetical protein|uniref:hypothetical protein n=1 Tax=Chryseobacterium lathyri TaxID=395933 RepID=UPI001CC1A10F|nr:hypothetical protein [Chryseobacterium lathyri]